MANYFLFFFILVMALILIISMLVSLVPLGDERSQWIKVKAQSNAFAALIGMLALDVVMSFIPSMTEWKLSGSSFNLLVSSAIIYLLTLAYYKKKFGD